MTVAIYGATISLAVLKIVLAYHWCAKNSPRTPLAGYVAVRGKFHICVNAFCIKQKLVLFFHYHCCRNGCKIISNSD